MSPTQATCKMPCSFGITIPLKEVVVVLFFVGHNCVLLSAPNSFFEREEIYCCPAALSDSPVIKTA